MPRHPTRPDRTAQSYDDLLARNTALQRAVEELSVLNELAAEIGASFDAEYILDRIVDRARRTTGAEQAVISLVGHDTPDPAKTVCRAMGSAVTRERYHLDLHLQGWMQHHRRPLLANDPRHDERLRAEDLPETVHSLLCVPLLLRMEVIGVLSVYNKRGAGGDGGGFDEEDQRLLSIIAMQSAQVIENARLYEVSQRHERMREELRLAKEIQQRLLPDAPPDAPGYDMAAVSVPARDVGGDYFDFVPLDDGTLAVALGDVSGKGLPASLLMANLQAALRGQVLFERSPAACARRVNRMLHCCTDPHLFATLFLGILDLRHHRITTCNAGHERPLLCRNGEIVGRPRDGGVPLGMLEDFPYREQTIELESGDTLVIFSDGVTDAESADGEPFTEDRFLAVVSAAGGEPARVVLDRVVEAVHEHTRGTDPFDDVTLLVVRRTP
ncbi:SpoIIE family protein phosphatase [bacterium]|nr:SpoIIE family protein phosphatase [bacterium]MBU1074164.1 SpoIIE family protein phosphatase [bacterium]MBU1675464.1 SpoIIE family protein phosphatase [bacterium]